MKTSYYFLFTAALLLLPFSGFGKPSFPAVPEVLQINTENALVDSGIKSFLKSVSLKSSRGNCYEKHYLKPKKSRTGCYQFKSGRINKKRG